MEVSKASNDGIMLLELLQVHIDALHGVQRLLKRRMLAIDQEVSKMWELYRRELAITTPVAALPLGAHPLMPASILDQSLLTLQAQIDRKRPDLLSQLILRSIAESASRFAGLTSAGLYAFTKDLELGG